MPQINQTTPWLNNQESKNIYKVVQKTYLTENKETLKFEKNIRNKLKAKFVNSYSNWTCGLYACLKILNLKSDDEVIVPNLTFIATINSVIMAGLRPVLCEINEDSLCLDLKKLKKCITKKTKAIIPVHLYGNCCDMDELKKICKKKKILIIEDQHNLLDLNLKTNFWEQLEILYISFYGNKIITTGEAAVITNKQIFHKKLYKFKNHGRSKKGIFKHDSIGFNFMFTEMQAAIGNVQLKKLDKIIKKKKYIYEYYKKNLKDLNEINFKDSSKNCKQVHWFTNIFSKNKKILTKYLSYKKIQTRSVSIL